MTDPATSDRIPGGPLGSNPAPSVAIPGLRVVLDARPLQEPDRAPVTAAYLRGLLGAFDADPLAGESFAFLLRSDLDDPTAELIHLDVIGRRLLPPTRVLRSGAMTIDPFMLRGASLGAAWHADRGGAAGAVYHMAGSGSIPIASGLPVVATLLDLAPWELPEAFGRSVGARFGQRLRAQLVREARAVIVSTPSVGVAARRLLHIRADRIHVVGLAPEAAFAMGGNPGAPPTASSVRARERLGVPERYLVYAGRYDARHDLATLLRALAALAADARPSDLADVVPWPPRVLVLGASPDDRAAMARAAARLDIGSLLTYSQPVSPGLAAELFRGARAAILPLASDAVGLGALDAIAVGTPVVAASVGALTDIVGAAGILVEPGDPGRLAVALRAVWAEDRVHARISEGARDRASTERRTWSEVARETRAVYAAAGIRHP